MRVAFDARSLHSPVLRGWDRYTMGLVRSLTGRGVEITLLCRERAPVHETHASTLGRPVIALPDKGGMWWEQVSLPRALRGFDLYHAPAEHGVPLFSRRPTVLTLHSATAHSYQRLIRRGLLKGTIKDYFGRDFDPRAATLANAYWYAQVARADRIIAVSDFARDEIVELVHVEPSRITAIPLAVDDAFRTPATGAAPRAGTLERLGVRQPYLLYVGGYEPHKNVAGLLEVFSRVRSRRPELSLVMVGSGLPDARLTDQAEHLDLTPGKEVVFLHALGPELPALYDGAELFVSLSWRESFGLPALEAMTRGIAVVASGWGAAPEVVGDGGRLVDPRDHQAAADAVVALLDDPTRGARARAAAARFSWDTTAAATLELYQSLLS